MKVALSDRTLLIAFRNISERIAHDAMPPGLMQALPNLFTRKATISHKKDGTTKMREHIAVAGEFRRFIKLRHPRCISTITTICSVYDLKDLDMPIYVGKSFYSRSETKRFDRLGAQRKSLGRALSEMGASDRYTIQAAFTAAIERRKEAAQVRAAAQAAAEAPSSPSVTQSVPLQGEGPNGPSSSFTRPFKETPPRV